MGEVTLSGTEEDAGEGGDDLLDLGAMISNKVAFLPTLHHLACLTYLYTVSCSPLTAAYPSIPNDNCTHAGAQHNLHWRGSSGVQLQFHKSS